MPSDRPPQRREKLLKALRRESLPAMLVIDETNVRYLTGFTGDSTYLLLTPDKAIVLSDGRFTTQISEECPGLEAVIRSTDETLIQATARVVTQLNLDRLAIEADFASLNWHRKLSETLPKTDLAATSGLVERLRAVKDAEEICAIRYAVRLAERSFAVLRASLMASQTEIEIARDLEYTVRKFGGTGMSFPPIIAVNDRAALPHYHPGDRTTDGATHLLVDWGVREPSGYVSDLTRTLLCGRPSKKLQAVYETVLAAQTAAIAAIAPGKTGREIDAIARGIIQDSGYGSKFSHGLGHGIGLRVHEAVRLSQTSDDVLEPGMVVTVEPGIYLPGWGGVRIEDDVLVTRDGAESISTLPKSFEAMILSH